MASQPIPIATAPRLKARIPVPIAGVPVDEFVECVRALVEIEKSWVPREQGEALYIRPLIFASEQHIAVRAAMTYTFVIVAGPVEPYFASGRYSEWFMDLRLILG